MTNRCLSNPWGRDFPVSNLSMYRSLLEISCCIARGLSRIQVKVAAIDVFYYLLFVYLYFSNW